MKETRNDMNKIIPILTGLCLLSLLCRAPLCLSEDSKDRFCVRFVTDEYYFLIPRLTATTSKDGVRFGAGLALHCSLAEHSLHSSIGPLVGVLDFKKGGYYAGLSVFQAHFAALSGHFVGEFTDHKFSGVNLGLAAGMIAMLYSEVGFDFLKHQPVLRIGISTEFPLYKNIFR